MTERSRFWTTSGSGDNETIIRDVWWSILGSLFGTLRDTTYQGGILHGSGDGSNIPLFVEESAVPDANVKVNIGRAIVRGAWFEADAAESVAIAANTDGSGFARIDYIILRKDVAAQTVRLFNLEGTPSGSPVAPTLTQTENVTWEFPIAQIAVANLFTTIVDANITYDRPNGIGQYAVMRSPEEGGTGIRTYADGDILYAGSADPTALSVVSVLGAGHVPVRDASNLISIDKRPITIGYGEASTVDSETGYTVATWITITINREDDDAGYVSLSSNQMLFVAGSYKMINWLGVIAATGGAPKGYMRLRNVTAGVDIAFATIPNATGGEIIWDIVSFETDGIDVYEFQIYMVDQGTGFLGWGRDGAQGGTPPTEVPPETYWSAVFIREF